MTAVRTHATNLRSLSLMNTNTISISEQSPIQVAVQSLLLINTHAHLQRLTIGFNQDDYPVDDSPWDELQDILLGTRFPALRSVEFCLSLKFQESIPVSTELFVATVPRLSQKKIVSVRHGPRDYNLMCTIRHQP